MLENNTEIEIKLVLDKKNLKELLDSALVSKNTIKGSKKELKLVSTYYDTPSLYLKQAGIAYRVRKDGKKYEATIKTDKIAAGGFSERCEYNLPLRSAKPIIEGFETLGFQDDLQDILQGETLEKLFTVDVKREVRLLKIRKNTTVELAIDQGEIKGEKYKDKIDEIEFEIKKGNLSELLNFIARLAEKVVFFVEPRSKFARGLALLGLLEKKTSSKKVKISSKELAYDEFRKMFFINADGVLKNQKTFLDSGKNKDAEITFLKSFENLEGLLAWTGSSINVADKIKQNLDVALKPLVAFSRLKRLLYQWEKIGYKENSLVTILLNEKIASLSNNINKQVGKGIYNRVMFAALAELEGAKWSNDKYLPAGEQIKCRLDELFAEINTLAKDAKKKLTAEQALKAYNLVSIIYANKDLFKGSSWDKSYNKQLEKAYYELQELCVDGYEYKGLLDFARGKVSPALNKEIGILLGWRMKLVTANEKKAYKEFMKLNDLLNK